MDEEMAAALRVGIMCIFTGLIVFGSFFQYWFEPEINQAEIHFLREFTRRELAILLIGITLNTLMLGVLRIVLNHLVLFLLLLGISFWYNGSHLFTTAPRNSEGVRFKNVNGIITKAYIVSLFSIWIFLLGSILLVYATMVLPKKQKQSARLSNNRGGIYKLTMKEAKAIAPILYWLIKSFGMRLWVLGALRFFVFSIISLCQPFITIVKFILDWNQEDHAVNNNEN